METAKPSIAIRCDASLNIGSGHVIRCLTLANALADRAEITFLCTEDTLKTVQWLKDSPYKISHDEKLSNVDWLIVDHYGLDEKYERAARKWAKKIFVIDDLIDRPHDCDVLLDQTYSRKPEEYKDLTPEDCKILTGTHYALLRPEFYELRTHLKRDYIHANRILVLFGGINPKNSTQFTLNTLADFKDKALHIDVVTGAGAEGINEIKSLVENIKNNTQHNIILHVNTPDVAKIMAESDICIGAGGTTSWERCALGLPTIAIELADNQKDILKILGAQGALLNMGQIEELSPEELLSTFSKLISDANKLKNMSSNATKICDGLGVKRSISVINPRTKFSLRPANHEDVKTLYEFQCEEGARTFSRTPEAPSFEEHTVWFENSLRNSGVRQIYILETESGEALGMLRLDKKDTTEILQEIPHNKNAYEVSILVSNKHHGKGVASDALMKIARKKTNTIFLAEILPENTISQNLFMGCGYIQYNKTWYVFET